MHSLQQMKFLCGIEYVRTSVGDKTQVQILEREELPYFNLVLEYCIKDGEQVGYVRDETSTRRTSTFG